MIIDWKKIYIVDIKVDEERTAQFGIQQSNYIVSMTKSRTVEQS